MPLKGEGYRRRLGLSLSQMEGEGRRESRNRSKKSDIGKIGEDAGGIRIIVRSNAEPGRKRNKWRRGAKQRRSRGKFFRPQEKPSWFLPSRKGEDHQRKVLDRGGKVGGKGQFGRGSKPAV